MALNSIPDWDTTNGPLHPALPWFTASLHASASEEQAATGDQLTPPSVELSKRTVPVGSVGPSVPGDTTLTVAPIATVCPLTEGLADELTLVTVEAASTDSVECDEVDPVKLESPEYTAWISTPEEDAANDASH